MPITWMNLGDEGSCDDSLSVNSNQTLHSPTTVFRGFSTERLRKLYKALEIQSSNRLIIQWHSFWGYQIDNVKRWAPNHQNWIKINSVKGWPNYQFRPGRRNP